jgi:PadR family transcriptional regulator, regulatory protein PadR
MHDLRITGPTERVLGAFLQAPDEGTYGYALVKASGMSSGAVYSILARLEDAGWIESKWEEPDHEHEQWPRRRRYQLTTDGLERAAAILPQMHRERTARLVHNLLPQPGPA